MVEQVKTIDIRNEADDGGRRAQVVDALTDSRFGSKRQCDEDLVRGLGSQVGGEAIERSMHGHAVDRRADKLRIVVVVRAHGEAAPR